MPVFFRCSSCGTIIYRFERVGQDCFGLPTPSELLTMFNGKCPACGKKLKLPSIDDIVITGRARKVVMRRASHHKVELDESLLHPLTIHDGTLRTASVSQ